MSTAAPDTARPSTERGAAPTPLPTSRYLSYGVGMIGERVFRDAPALLLLLYMTEYLAVPAAMAGLAVFIPKLVIIALDPLVGSLSDSLNTRWGRRRPLMLVGAFLTSAALVAFFHVPPMATAGATAFAMGGLITLGFAGYALFSVPYLTMGSEIASSSQERAKLMSSRVVFMALGLTVGAFAGSIVELGGGGRSGYAFMAWLLGGLCLATMLTTVFTTGFASARESNAGATSLPDQVRLIAGNARYRLLLVVGLLQKLGEGIGYGSFAFFCIYVVHQPLSALGIVVLSATVGQIVAQPFWLALMRRWSAPAVYTLGVLGWCLNLLLWLLMDGRSIWWLIPLGLQAGLAAGGFLMVTLSMLTDAIADDTARSGLNREGIYSGVWLGIEKAGFALGALVVGLMLDMFGFVESAAGAGGPQTAWAVLGIAITYSGLNCVVYLLSIWPVMRYRRFTPAPLPA